MSSFTEALQENQAPRSLGDVTLRYEPSMLLGETERGDRSWLSTAAWLLGVAATLLSLLALMAQWPDLLSGLLIALAAGAWMFAVWRERVDRRRRRFVVNFATASLRLDFVTPFAGKRRTLVVHFDGVRDVKLFEQADSRLCLTVDFVPAPGSTELLREVLVAFIADEQTGDAVRLQRVLHNAFGLGDPPPDSPVFEEEPPGAAPADEFLQ